MTITGHGATSHSPTMESIQILQQYVKDADITYIFVSHPDAENYNLLPLVYPNPYTHLKNLKYIYLGGQRDCYSEKFREWLGLLGDAEVVFVNEGKSCYGCQRFTSKDLCSEADSSFSMEIVSANLGTSSNAQSLVLQIAYGGRKMLLTADLEGEAQYESLMQHIGPQQLKSDVLQLARRGSSHLANYQYWLNAVNAEHYVSNSKKRDSGRLQHPSCTTFRRIGWIPDSNVAHVEPHPTQCGEPFTSTEEYPLGIYQTLTLGNSSTPDDKYNMWFVISEVSPDGNLSVSQHQALESWDVATEFVNKPENRGDNLLFDHAACPIIVSGVSGLPGDGSMLVNISIDSEEMGFFEPFGDAVGMMYETDGEFRIYAQYEGFFDHPGVLCDEMTPSNVFSTTNPTIVVSGNVEDIGHPSKWKTEIFAGVYSPDDFTMNELYCMIHSSESGLYNRSIECNLKMSLGSNDFQAYVGTSQCLGIDIHEDIPQAAAADFLGEPVDLEDWWKARRSRPISEGVFDVLLPFKDNPDPLQYDVTQVVDSPLYIRFKNITGFIAPNSTEVIKLWQTPGTSFKTKIGPFSATVKDAYFNVFPNRPGSTQRNNFSGGIDLEMDFPFFGEEVSITSGLNFPIKTTSPFAFNVSLPPFRKFFNLSFSGSVLYYGRYNPNNIGLLKLKIPGFVNFTTNTTLNFNRSISELPLLVPDFFSGINYNSSGKYTFEGFAGSAKAAFGKMVMKKSKYYFKRLLDELVPEEFQNLTDAATDAAAKIIRESHPDLHRTLGLQSLAGYHDRGHLLDFADDAENLLLNHTLPTFPTIKLPTVNFSDVGGLECIGALFGDDRSESVFNNQGNISVMGIPMRYVLPKGFLDQTSVDLENFFGFSQRHRIRLNDITIDIRKLPVNGTSSIYEVWTSTYFPS